MRAVTALFFASGAAGLVDQVCFSKYLSYVVGATAYAVSAVLGAFMAGLALGAMLGGKLSRVVRRPLAAYGIAELCAGATVAVTPWAFGALTPAYVEMARHAQGSIATLSVVRWAMTLLLVATPTVAMGATLPLLSPALGADTTTAKRRLGALYAANTFGGAIGALLGAYVLLPIGGLSRTLHWAALASAIAGCTALGLGTQNGDTASEDGLDDGDEASSHHDVTARRATAPSNDALGTTPLGATSDPHSATASPPPSDPAPLPLPSAPPLALPDATWLGVLSFASGFIVFTLEVVTTHLLAVIIGSSVYAFGLILAGFLTWLFVGATIAPRFAERFGARALATSLGLQALALTATLPLWDRLPLAFGGLGDYVTTFEGREAMRALVAFGILAVPTTLMGLTFPLILNRAAERPDLGRLVGRFTALNTVGAVVGAMAAGYVVLPKLGSERSILAVAFALAALSATTALRADRARARLPLGLAAAALAVGFIAPRWDIERLTSGTNVYFDTSATKADLLHVREDVHGGITTVTVRDGVHTLYTNGKFQGNDGWELNAQRYFAHYPCLFVKDFDKALIVGFGTGTTLGSLATYPWKELDVVEISPAILEASGTYFSTPNRHVLDDPRVHVTLDDARNYLLVHDGRYQLISMELSSVWFAGAASLYSREYYRMVRAHLDDDGVFQQWVQLHHVYPSVFAALVNTLRGEFEHVALFYGGGQGILVASNRPLRWSRSRASKYTADPVVGETLPNGRPLEALTNDILAMDEGLDHFLDDSAREAGTRRADLVSTDDNLFLEYETPRGNVLPWAAREALVATLRQYRDSAAIAGLDIDATNAGAN
jgi:spermidine synthase